MRAPVTVLVPALVAVALASACPNTRTAPDSGHTRLQVSAASEATTVYHLDNGMRVLIREDHFAPVVALQVWVDAGGADESDEEAGVAHVHEHMLFKGTERRGLGEIAGAVEGAGGRINAWTSWDNTVYHLVLASRHAELGLDVLADAVRNSSFDPGELDKELAVVMEEYRRGLDRPGNRLFHALFGKAFDEHPYRRPVIGTEASITGLTREKILDFYGRHYAPNNMELLVIGDVDTEETKTTVERLFGDFASAPTLEAERPVEPEQNEFRFEAIEMSVKEAHLAIGFHIPEAEHSDTPGLDLLSTILGSGESSRMYRRLVAEDESATGVSVFAYTPPDPGMFVVTASMEPSRTTDVYKTIVSELVEILEAAPETEELERARTNLEADFVFRSETVQGQARELGYALTVHDDPDYDEEYIRRINAVGLAELSRLARHYLRPDNMTVVTLMPEDAGADGRLEEAEARQLAAPLGHPVAGAGIDAGTAVPSPETAETVSAAADTEARLLRLDNGLRVIIQEHHEVPVFSVRAAMLGGLLAETADNNGVSNFAAEMITRGTEQRDREQFARAVESLGGGVEGFSGRNSLGVSGAFLSSRFEEGMELFLESLLDPAFDPDEVEKTRRELLLAIHHREDSSSRVAFDLAFKTVFPTHPYGMTTLGEETSVGSLDAQTLRAFYETSLDPANMIVTVVGDIDSARVTELLTQRLGKLEPGRQKFKVTAADAPSESMRRAGQTSEREQSHIVLAWPSVAVDHPDRHALTVLDTVLSGQSGRLFTELRDKRSLAYSVGAFFTQGLSPGLFGAYMATDPSQTVEATRGLIAEFQRVAGDEVGREELGRAKRYLIGSHEIALQSNGAIAEEMTFNELYGLGFLAGRDYAAAIEAVTAVDVRRVAGIYLDLGRRTEVVVGPTKDQSE